jgi:predicted permease
MLDGYVRAASAALMAAVALVLVIACANVANLLLARGASRRREFAIRAAIGASRGRIIRQLLSEGLLLAAAGGSLGVLIAWWAGHALAGLGTGALPIPVSFDFSIDRTVLAFAVLASVSTALLFGLAPAWSSSKPELVPGLKASVERPRTRRVSLSDALVVGQLALSLVLLVAGSLLARGLITARHTDLGFDPRPISSLGFNLQMNGYDMARATAFRDRAIETIRALPGVTAVSVATRLPLAPDINVDSILVPGRHAAGDDGTSIDTVRVGAGYFDAVGVPIVAGRQFTDDDIRGSRRVAVVNETMARQFWPTGSAVGQRIYSGRFDSPAFEVVGVARDHKVRSVGEAPRPYLHLPASPSRTIGLVVRTSTPATAALPMLRQALWTLEPEILFTQDLPAEEVAATTVAPTRIGAMVLGAFGGLALLLAVVGLYGVVAYSVGRRTREIGIRMALGATRRSTLRMILLQGGRLALTGAALGAVASLGVARLLESLLYGVSGFDPAAYLTAATVLLLVAFGANLIPAMTAARIDPVRSLRSE